MARSAYFASYGRDGDSWPVAKRQALSPVRPAKTASPYSFMQSLVSLYYVDVSAFAQIRSCLCYM